MLIGTVVLVLVFWGIMAENDNNIIEKAIYGWFMLLGVCCLVWFWTIHPLVAIIAVAWSCYMYWKVNYKDKRK